jgi:hypothetical protein
MTVLITVLQSTVFQTVQIGVESVDRDEKDNLIQRATGYLNRQIERLCIVIQGSERRRRTSNNTPLVLIIILVEAGVRLCWHSRGYF